MQVIALTGGIASGKSTVAKRFAELGATRIDADELAREAVAQGRRGLTLVAERFGEDVLQADGTLNRAKLGDIVFGDAEALAALNAIVHPEVRRLFAERVANVCARDEEAVVVYEIPLLAEAQESGEWGMIVVTEAPAELRVRRMTELRGMTPEDARRRIANQASDAQRRSLADVIIDTSGSEADTLAQVDALWARITADS